MTDQAQLVRGLRIYVQGLPGRWPTLWENQSSKMALPFMTVQVVVADGQFASNAKQQRIQGLINFGFLVVAGDPSQNARAEEEAARIAALMEGLPGVRLTAPPQVVDGSREEERWRVGLIVRWEKLP